MAIYDILCKTADRREREDGICQFNGFLEDYLSLIEENEEDSTFSILKAVFEEDPNIKICVDLRLNINREAIANQIIRYKDSFKLPKGTIICPYVLYGKMDDVQKAFIITLGDKEEYILAKALYYVMSEPENEYEGTRNEIIATSVRPETCHMLVNSMKAFFHQSRKAGIVQRELDMKIFNSYDEMYIMAKDMGDYMQAHLMDILDEAEDREHCINEMIAKWFLLKKFTYVQYMMDKTTLNKLHEGNVKKQRQVAKEKCDGIGFISYSDLWNLAKKSIA